ncbi:MAG: hypothetical protein WKF57_06030 [Nakamurella sp.]
MTAAAAVTSPAPTTEQILELLNTNPWARAAEQDAPAVSDLDILEQLLTSNPWDDARIEGLYEDDELDGLTEQW